MDQDDSISSWKNLHWSLGQNKYCHPFPGRQRSLILFWRQAMRIYRFPDFVRVFNNLLFKIVFLAIYQFSGSNYGLYKFGGQLLILKFRIFSDVCRKFFIHFQISPSNQSSVWPFTMNSRYGAISSTFRMS